MPVLLVIGKILGVLLLLLVLAAAAALFVPMRLIFEYRPGYVQLAASYGPLRRTLFSRGDKRRRKNARGPQHSVDAAPQPETAPPPAPKPREPSVTQSAPLEASAPPVKAASTPPEEQVEQETESGRVEHILNLARQQPMELSRCLAGHFRWMRRHAVCKLRVRHLDVFWTVTCEDAADTAMAFGAEMAAFNTLLALLQQSISVQSDRLWLEPDFTGTRRSERRVSFCLSACAVLMIGLAYRLWKDPLLQPQPETAQV